MALQMHRLPRVAVHRHIRVGVGAFHCTPTALLSAATPVFPLRGSPPLLAARKVPGPVAAPTPASDVEARYQRMDPVQHVLLRPGMYVGSTEPLIREEWVWDAAAVRMVLAPSQQHVPALLKIVDEILVNACDNAVRDASMRQLAISVGPQLIDGKKQVAVSIANDGAPVPVEMHSKEGVYIPQLVFGTLLTGSNFADGSVRLATAGNNAAAATGGRHGYGAKLTNIFSTYFAVHVTDAARGKVYDQVWRNNMSAAEEPRLTTCSATASNVTRITFVPDWSRFGLKDGFDEGTLALVYRRAVDTAGLLGATVKVTYNDSALPVTTFQQYAALFTPPAPPAPAVEVPAAAVGMPVPTRDTDALPAHAQLGRLVHTQLSNGWDVVVGAAGLLDASVDALHAYNEPRAISFVNSMHTPRGGSHVNLFLDALAKKLQPIIAKRAPELAITHTIIKQHMRVWIHARVEGATFDSQAKEQLTSAMSEASAKLQLTDKFVKAVAQDAGVGPAVVAALRAKADAAAARELKRSTKVSDNKIKSIPKLEDANLAGTRRAHECTLIVTEGDSAKALAVAGLAVVGRDRFGVFPLRGKVLNVHDMTPAAAMENAEVSALVQILGLDFKKSYRGLSASERGLRYGSIMIMSDQDVDGAHIKGLLVNLFHRFWPHLVSSCCGVDGSAPFVEQFITPVIKARRGTTVREFFNMRDFSAWQAEVAGSSNPGSLPPPSVLPNAPGRVYGEASQGRWYVKYYKGLGTSTASEGRAYFGALQAHRIGFSWGGPQDAEALNLAFAKSRADARKTWISAARNDAASITGAAVTVASASPAQAAAAEQPPKATKPKTAAAAVSASVGPVVHTSVSTFINEELIEFSRADVLRSIPSVVDGLKPSQRKVLFACFKRAGKPRQRSWLDSSATATSVEAQEESSAESVAVDEAHTNSFPIAVGPEVKVAQLAGYVAEHTAYHHGEASLTATITSMAQDYVGSNNLPLLAPIGQFGTRLQGGKDAASARYIYTRLSPFARLLFPWEDDELLRRREDDGQAVEPVAYVPTVPLVLINGGYGIGTGWSTYVPQYNPFAVMDAVEAALEKAGGGDADPSLGVASDVLQTPWWRGFTGGVSATSGDSITTCGAVEWCDPSALGKRATARSVAKRGGKPKAKDAVLLDDSGSDSDGWEVDGKAGAPSSTHVRITELPVGRWTEDYKVFLLSLVNKGVLHSMQEHHTETRAEFVCHLSAQGLDELRRAGGDLTAFFKLAASLSLRNMHLFNSSGVIARYARPADIMRDFLPVRSALYVARKQRQVQELEYALAREEARCRFLNDVVSGDFTLRGRSRADLVAALHQARFPGLPPNTHAATTAQLQTAAALPGVRAALPFLNLEALVAQPILYPSGDASAAGGGTPVASDYDYLLNTPLWQLSQDALNAARGRVDKLRDDVTALKATAPQQLWKRDLALLRAAMGKDSAFRGML